MFGGTLWWGRRVLLFAMLAWGVWTLLHDGVPKVCHGAVAETVVMQVCEPMSATDPRVLLFLLLVILLLYARLLIDILGETPQNETAGTSGPQEGE